MCKQLSISQRVCYAHSVDCISVVDHDAKALDCDRSLVLSSLMLSVSLIRMLDTLGTFRLIDDRTAKQGSRSTRQPA